MRVRWLASALLLVAACGSGEGTPITMDLDGRESPGPGRENPGQVREVPRTTRDDPGPTNTSSSCLDCAQAYQCTFENETFPASLSQTASGCTLSGLLLRCDGKVIQDGQAVADWRKDGNGHLILVVSGIQYDCKPVEATTNANGQQG